LYLYQSMEHLDFMAEAYAKSLSRFISSNWSSTQGKRFFWWSCNFFVFNGAIWSMVSSNLFLRNSRFCSMFVRSFSESKFSWFICSIIIFTFSSFKLRVIFDNCVDGIDGKLIADAINLWSLKGQPIFWLIVLFSRFLLFSLSWSLL
jgi:hypothetical protein